MEMRANPLQELLEDILCKFQCRPVFICEQLDISLETLGEMIAGRHCKNYLLFKRVFGLWARLFHTYKEEVETYMYTNQSNGAQEPLLA